MVECVPNVSEGRRLKVVDAIGDSILGLPGVWLLDRHSDPDHNRSVFTLVGTPSAIAEAAFRIVASAAEQIDMTQHRGAHPRIGAADVVPFIPIEGLTRHDCVALAHEVGARIGDELSVPVYYYGDAATRPETSDLSALRRGQYEGLRDAIQDNPARQPDTGPSRLGSAGATAIGVRGPLVAFNVWLNSDDVEIARRVARALRTSSGGLQNVKAMGVLVGGRAQVSMNLTDTRRTPIAPVVEMVRREAARYGSSIWRSELVGLAPRRALLDAAIWYLQLPSETVQQTLEDRIQGALGRSIPLLE
ncbi:MAG: glutamate formimidoyltransferase [Chloroflexi bacterium]|nr:glutamate formimidoyltransferase [Chloroflexota bacterium]